MRSRSPIFILCFLISSMALGQIVELSDAAFKDALTNQFCIDTNGDNIPDASADTNGDGEIQVSEALAVTALYLDNRGINSMEEIVAFSNLQKLYCSANNLSNLNVSSLNALETLSAEDNQISSLSLSASTSLRAVYLNNNRLESLDLQLLGSLEIVELASNQLTNLEIEGLSNLLSLNVSNNELPGLYLDGNASLAKLYLANNRLNSLDIMSARNLRFVNADNNELEFMLLKNNALTTIAFQNNTELSYICADDSNLTMLEERLLLYGNTEVVVNTECSFTSSDEAYFLSGQANYDPDSDGCDPSAEEFSLLSYSISNGSTTDIITVNSSGGFSIPLSEGSYTVTPLLENPEYFEISPSVITVDFPADADSSAQNFCVSPRGNFTDLEVVLFPVGDARPGFESEYILQYRNRGTTVLSDEVSVYYQDDLMDFVSADMPVTSSAFATLNWDFFDLQPLEQREIRVRFRLNRPTDTPPVESGDLLTFRAEGGFDLPDYDDSNNTISIHQYVVNAMDPNDKTILEGPEIFVDQVGEYVHYMIRFENLGTANATNVVVADTIDTSKYQLSTLIPIRGSHDFVTRINDNVVEFIFEDINLPFDDANNDGFVLFKIKTQETLVLGDSFRNSAAIYFDFNAPIITNEATTTVVSTLGTNDHEADLNLRLYPNPAREMLNISGLENREVKALSVYNLQGQLLINQYDDTSAIDVSGLSSGVYFVKIETAEGAVFKRFLKQ